MTSISTPLKNILQKTRCLSAQTTGLIGTLSRLSLLVVVLVAGPSYAFTKLTDAQGLIYDKSHLANTTAGQTLTYMYANKSTLTDPTEDTVTLNITMAHPDDKRDVVLDFLTEERRIPFPDFDKFRGNPVIIATLEHFAQSIGRETGGGILYFRNRIRDALAAETVLIENQEIDWNGKTIQSTQLTFSPFIQDPYLAERPEYKFAEFSITLSDEAPGNVIGITMLSRKDGHFYFSRGIELKASGE